MSSTTRSKNIAPITQPESKSSAGRWSPEEHQRFVDALKLYGKNWKKVEEIVGTRDGTQIRSHAQKYFAKLEKEKKHEKKAADKKDRFEPAESLRKSSESSISTHHTQQGRIIAKPTTNLSGQLENSTEQLKENLPLSESKAQGPKTANAIKPEEKSKDASVAGESKIDEETREEAKSPVQSTQSELVTTPVKQGGSQPMTTSVYETLLNNFFQNMNLANQQRSSTTSIPFLGLLPSNVCVYLNLR